MFKLKKDSCESKLKESASNGFSLVLAIHNFYCYLYFESHLAYFLNKGSF